MSCCAVCREPIVFEGGKWVRLARGEHIADPAGDQHGGHVPEKPWTERAGKAAVKARSGGRCELGGPTCLLIAHDVDHVFGRRGPDPHNPDGLLHLCGFGNANGGCHQWVSQRAVGRAASIWVVEQIASES